MNAERHEPQYCLQNSLPRSRQHGLLLLNKKSGVTSFDSLREVKKAFNTQKAGHTGTLDKFASGLLLVLVGRGVKLAPLFDQCTKEYSGVVRFGEETDTLDPEGAVVARGPVPSRDEVEAVLSSFRGDILQAPPEYSAIHINGRRAHELVREGKAPEMKKRPVTVYELEISSWAPPEAVLRVRCSAGTYIRSLARDIALAAGSRGSLSALTRTRVGKFRLEDASDADDRDELVKSLRLLDRNFFEALQVPCFYLDPRAAEGFIHGRPLEGLLPEVSDLSGGKDTSDRGSGMEDRQAAGVFRESSGGEPDELVGVLERRNGRWSYGHVFADS